MKTLKYLIFATFFATAPVHTFAHGDHGQESDVTEHKAQFNALTKDNIASADLSSFRNCNGNQSCEIVKAEIVKILQQLIKELIIEIEKEKQRIALGDEDQEDEEEDGGSEDEVDQDEEDRIEYTSRLSEEPLNKGRSKSFKVNNGEAEIRDSSHPVFKELWKLTREAFPEEHRKKLRYFKFINKPSVENAAYVEISAKKKNNDVKTYFDLVLNLDDVKVGSFAQQQRSIDIIIHELGHVIAFSEDQVRYFVEQDDCRFYYTEDLGACSLSTSYYTEFYREFWDDDFYDASQEYLEDDDYEIIEDFYSNNKDSFVSEYAASSPDEDLAESMLYFLTKSRKADDSLDMNAKINSFYDFPEMIEVRNYIQRNLFYLL